MKFIKVDGCNHCPFCGFSEAFIPDAIENFCRANDNKDIALSEDGELIGSPSWCPLNTDDFCISKRDYKKVD